MAGKVRTSWEVKTKKIGYRLRSGLRGSKAVSGKSNATNLEAI